MRGRRGGGGCFQPPARLLAPPNTRVAVVIGECLPHVYQPKGLRTWAIIYRLNFLDVQLWLGLSLMMVLMLAVRASTVSRALVRSSLGVALGLSAIIYGSLDLPVFINRTALLLSRPRVTGSALIRWPLTVISSGESLEIEFYFPLRPLDSHATFADVGGPWRTLRVSPP